MARKRIQPFVRLPGDRAFTLLQDNTDRVFRSIDNYIDNLHVKLSGTFLSLSGTEDNPAYSFVASTNSGLFLSGSDADPYVSLSVSGSRVITADKNGNVGVGTTSPSQQLEIYSTTTNANRLRMTQTSTTAGGYQGLEFFATSTFKGGIFREQNNDNIEIWNDGAAILTVDQNGDVGIGTTSPAAKLEVEDANQQLQLTIDASNYVKIGPANTSYCHFNATGLSNGFYFNKDVIVDGGIIGAYNEDLQLQAPDGSTRMTIDSTTGNVGIGTTNPSEMLHVASTTDAHIFLEGDTDNDGSETGTALLKLTQDGGAVSCGIGTIQTSGQDPEGNTFTDALVNRLLIYNKYSAGGIQFGTQTAVAMTIDESLEVGIGTTSPSYPLDVAGDEASDYVANFFNDGNNANRYGLRIQAGADDGSGLTYYISAADGDGTLVGRIQNNAGTFELIDSSDERLKTEIRPSKVQGIETIKKINPIEYKFARQEPQAPIHSCGFSAQNLLQAFPEAVSADPETGTLGVSKTSLIPVLVKAIQELIIRVEQLESEQ